MYAPFYDEKNSHLDTFEQGKLRIMLGDLKGKKVLDAACGTGRLIPLLQTKGATVTGLDISEKMIEIAQKKFPKAELLVGDMENMPFKDQSFDLVVAAFAIVHLKYLDKFFEECYKVLKNDGKIILTNINQKKAPKLNISGGKKKNHISIESYYHIQEHLVKALENSFFRIEKDELVYEDGVWINEIVVASK